MLSPWLRWLKRIRSPAAGWPTPVYRDRIAVTKLFNELGPRYRDRPGGYLRILKCGYRVGDKAPMAIVELVSRAMDSEEKNDGTDN